MASHRGPILAFCCWNKQAVRRDRHNPCRVFQLLCCDGSLISQVFWNIVALAGFELKPSASSCGWLVHLSCICLMWLIDDHYKLFIYFLSILLGLCAPFRVE